jgi:hypothetical protein
MKNNTILFDFLCINSLRRFANKNSVSEKNTITVKNIHKRWILMPLMVLAFLFGNVNVSGQTTVTYAMQTGNFNSLQTERNNNPPYSGSYNNTATELGQYANGGSFGNTPGAAAFQTFSSSGAGSGTARTLKVGDRFTVTCYVSTNPSAGGYIGISFRASTTYTNFFSATDASTVARFQLDNTGNWKVYSGSSVVATSSSGPNADRTFSIEITSSNTFNATIGSETFYDLSFGTAGPISSFSIYTFGDSNANSFWKNGSLTNFGHSAGDGLRFGYGLSGSSSSSISGIISDGITTNSTATSLANVVRVGGASGTSVTLSGTNTFTGLTTVNANGTLRLGASSTTSGSGPLGTTGAGTSITSGGVLDMNGFSLTSTATEALTINGTGISSGGALINSSGTGSTWAGTVALGSDASVGGSGSTTLSGVVSGANSLTKVGIGTVTLSNTNTFGGAGKSLTIAQGTVSINSFTNALGDAANTFTLGTSSTSGTLSTTSGTGNVSRSFSVALGGGTLEIAGSGTPTFLTSAGTYTGTLNGEFTVNCSSTGGAQFNLGLSGAGGMTINSSGSGVVTMGASGAAAATYSGDTKITAGTLQLGVANMLPNSSKLLLNGGTFSTGATTGYAETIGTLQLTENSTILLGTGSHNLNFSASNSTAWTAGKTLTITGWTGTASGGTAGRIYVGSSGSGLTQAQLDAINFTGQQPGAQIISGTGEIVPNFTVTITSAQSGDWNSTSTWVGGAVPDSIDNVVIAAGHTVTVTADATCRKVNFTGTGGLVSVNTGITLTVSTSVNVDQADQNNAGTISGLGTLTCTSINVGTSAPSLTAGRTTTLTSSISTLTSTGSITLTSRNFSSNNNNPLFYLQSGTLTCTDVTTVHPSGTNTATISLTTGAATGTLKLTGATPFTLDTDGTNSITLNGSGATVEYSGTAQTVRNTSYTNLTLSGSGNKTMAAFAVSGKLSLQGTAAAITTAPSSIGTLEYKGSSSQTTTAIEWPSSGVTNVIIDNSAGVTMGSGLSRTISGSLTLTSGTLTTAANTLTYSGSSISRTSGNIDASNASGVVAFTNTTGVTLPASIFSGTVSTFTVNGSGGLTLGGNTTIGTLNLTSGILTVGSANTVTINSGGSVARTSGALASGTGAGKFSFSGTGTVSSTVGFNDVDIAGGVNFGTASTINGTLTINGGGFVNTNAPIYASTSTLLYNSGSTYGRGSEWSTTSGAGYPNNVQISNSTTLNLGANSGTGTARQLAGNLTVDASSVLTMNASGQAMTQALTVKGNYINNGTTTLSGSIGGDLALEGNLTDNNVFTANGRAIFFRGGNTQSITSNTNPLDIDVVRMEKTGGEVLLLQNLLVDETADPIKFEGTSSILNLNGYTATLGKASTASTITMNSTSAIKGSSTSSLIILGTGAAGTIRFDQTTPGTTNVLQNLTINRTSTGTVTLGNALTLGGNLTLTDGTLTVGGNTLTYSGSSIARTSGVIDASNASATLAFTNTSALTLPASLFSSNVNNLTMNGTGGVTLGSATTVAGVLNLLSGDIITSSTNTLTLSATASITNGGSSSYIEGPLDRTLANGSSFSYPIGGNSTNYRPLNLNSVVVTGNPVVRVTVAETGATTVDGTTLESLLNSRNWRVEQISGTFTSATLVITESSITNGTHEIGKSNNNQAGTYVSLGSQTVSAGAITSPVGQGVGFYAIGVKASCTNPTASGTIAETQTICSGGDPATFTSSVAASGNVGTLEYKWQYSSTSDFSSDINDIASSNAETYDAPSGLTATRYYRRLARVSCKADWTGAAESNILTVTVRTAFTTGEISSTGQSICSGGTPTEIGSTTAASGGDASITYSWRLSSDSYSAAIDGATSATYTPPSGLTSTTSYRRYANDGTCNTTATVSTATWTVTVYDSFTSGTISSTGQSICSGGTPTEIGSTTAASGGDGSITYSWRSSSDSYSAAIDGATSTTYTPPSGLTVTTSYRRYANDGTCNTTATVSTATWTVTVFDTFTSGAIETTGETICNGGDPVTIGSDTDASGGDDSITYKWKANGVDIASTNSATYNPPSGLTTTTTYTRYAKDANCNTTFELSSGSYVVTVTAAPASAGNNGSILLCAGITLTETLLYNALTGSPAAGGTWSPTIPTSGSVAGTYTYTQESSPCVVNTATVTVTDSEIVTWNGSWSPSAPTASTSAVIQSTYQSSESITACSLRVTSGATVVILSGTVSLNGPIIAESSNSFVTFNNNAILLQNGSGYVNTGNINYKKASSPIFRLDYTLWSSPLTADSQPIFSFSPQTLTNRFYTYNEATNFYSTNDMYSSGTPALSASSSFKVGRGYLIRSPNNWVSSPSSAAAWTGTFTGVPNNGDISVAINYSGENKGYNAVGNPYPSPISITSFLSDNSGVIGSTLWFWRKTNGVSGSAYVTYSAGTYSSGSHSVFNIQPGQGFFVRATSSGSLQFKNSQRVGTNGSFFRNNSQTTATGEGRLWLNLKSNAIVVGNMALGYKEGATNDLDLVYDGEYLNDSSLALTSSLPGKELSVQHRAAPFVDTDVVPLSFKTDVAGTYSIDFNGTDGVLDTQDIYLEDLLLGQSVNIKTTPYTFASAAGTFTDRFRIVYINNALGTDVPVFNANQVVIYKNEINDFVINSGNVIMSNIKVYDVRGRLLQEYKNVNDSQTTINVGLVNQVLFVQITSEDGVMVTKKVIR